jgi:hypothetical protein
VVLIKENIMSETNYNETVVIPVLQRKYQELINNNLFLEVNLMVEQAKNKDLLVKIQNLEQKLETKKSKKKEEVTFDANTY